MTWRVLSTGTPTVWSPVILPTSPLARNILLTERGEITRLDCIPAIGCISYHTNLYFPWNLFAKCTCWMSLPKLVGVSIKIQLSVASFCSQHIHKWLSAYTGHKWCCANCWKVIKLPSHKMLLGSKSEQHSAHLSITRAMASTNIRNEKNK